MYNLYHQNVYLIYCYLKGFLETDRTTVITTENELPVYDREEMKSLYSETAMIVVMTGRAHWTGIISYFNDFPNEHKLLFPKIH